MTSLSDSQTFNHSAIWRALEQACLKAEDFRGATSPNPPVGAAALDLNSQILSVSAHPKAGQPHAEARVLQELAEKGQLSQVHTMVVTLEPCDHHGRTPPCSEALLRLPSLRRVAYVAQDPNPKAKGGAARLAENGIEVLHLASLEPSHPFVERALDLTRPFFHWIRTRKPWVTIKTVWREHEGQWTMIPPIGAKTFSSERSLRLAHELRRRADAIVTASGTVLTDWPELTVRRVPDHLEKTRWLAIMDRRRQVPASWIKEKRKQGFRVVPSEKITDFPSLLEFLGDQGVLEVLVEAGPTFSEFILTNGLWNESVRIEKTDLAADQIYVHRNY